MSERLKEFVNVLNQEGSASIPLVAPALGEKAMVTDLRYTVEADNVVETTLLLGEYPLFSGDEVVMNGLQLVEPANPLTLSVTDVAYNLVVRDQSFFRESVANGSQAPTGTASVAGADIGQTNTITQVTLPTGETFIAALYVGAVDLLTMDGALLDTLAFPATVYGIMWNGTELVSKSEAVNSSIYTMQVSADGTLNTPATETITGTYSTFKGRGSNQGGVAESHGGRVYIADNSTGFIYVSEIDDPTVFNTRITLPSNLGSYVSATAIVTTTEETPRNLLVIAGSDATFIVDLSDNSVIEYGLAGEVLDGQTTFYGNTGCEVLPGVFQGIFNTNWLSVDLNSGEPVFDKGTGGHFGQDFAWNTYAAHLTLKTPTTYSAYVSGVEITE